MVSGGMCRNPGPSFSVFLFPVPVGSALAVIRSPGRTVVVVKAAMAEEELRRPARMEPTRSTWGGRAVL